MIVAIIQARMGSTRLPGKVLEPIGDRPMLGRVVDRVRRARRVDQVVVATSTSPADDAVAAFCASQGIACFRGSENDVLDRYYRAAKQHRAEAVVRVTADCPLTDPEVIDRVVERFQAGGCDYAANVLHRTFPDGLDLEVFSFAALEQAWREATRPSDREHVTLYLLTSGKFVTANVQQDEVPGVAAIRWTVDDPRDLEFLRRIYAAFDHRNDFGWRDVVRALRERPELARAADEVHDITMNEGHFKSLYEQAEAGPAPRRGMQNSQTLLERARRVIPGGAQTFSKGFNQYVQGVSPVFLERGKGCRVWDVDGNEYVDYVQGLLPNILGYANEEVNAAAAEQYARGHSFSLSHPVEVELAEKLVEIIPCAEMVRFGKNGSDATSGAVRAARALTGRERVACCGYHGWQDWYIGSTTRNRGVPAAVCGLTHPFVYNDLASLDRVLEEHPGEFAAVIMEPVNFYEPQPGFLEGVKERARRHGALLIFDEICTGFHLGLGGAQKKFGVIPDLAAFGKAMGNGYPISCIVGRAEVMRIFEEVFVSFTFAGEVASMAAARKVLEILEQTDALARIETSGRRLQDGFNALVRQAGLEGRFHCQGYPSWSLMRFKDAEGKDSLLERSLFQQELVKRGILTLVTHNMTAAHDFTATEQTLEAYAAVLKTLSGWLSDARPEAHLEGERIQPVFRVR